VKNPFITQIAVSLFTSGGTAPALLTITAYRNQGKMVDSVIISADARKKELFFVAASRGRSEIAVVTSDREQLRDSDGVSTMRQSAIELARKQLSAHDPEKGPPC